MMGLAGFPWKPLPPETEQQAEMGTLIVAALMIAIMVVCLFFIRRWRD
jgi:Mg2+ and Co2+ transporter CorA